MGRDWDAASYDSLPIPMTRWGRAVVDRLPLRGDERVLDAGCGTGQVTAHLRERVPEGTVVALDAAASMVDAARSRLGSHRMEYLVHDLLQPIPGGPYDAVLSTATFHWVSDHDRLFTNLATAMRPGATLAAQCGGPGNVSAVSRALCRAGHTKDGTHFPTPDDTARRLADAGFGDIRCWTQDEPTPVPEDRLEEYLRTICLGSVIHGMDPREARALVTDVAGGMDRPVIDYVRLNMTAVRMP